MGEDTDGGSRVMFKSTAIEHPDLSLSSFKLNLHHIFVKAHPQNRNVSRRESGDGDNHSVLNEVVPMCILPQSG